MTAWLRSRGERWCQVLSFVSPGDRWHDRDRGSVPAIVGLRLPRTIVDVVALTLELGPDAIHELRVCSVEATSDGSCELVAELGARLSPEGGTGETPTGDEERRP